MFPTRGPAIGRDAHPTPGTGGITAVTYSLLPAVTGPITAQSFAVHGAWWQNRWLLVLGCVAILLAVAVGFALVYRTALRRRTRQLQERSAASALAPDRRDQLASAVGDPTDGAKRVGTIVQSPPSLTGSEEDNHVPLEISEVLRAAIPTAAEVAGSGPASVPPASAPRRRVMVVDDEPLVVGMLERVLRRDHDVLAVSCGREALDQISRGAWFDAIVSDVMMPNMTGIELLEQLVRVAPEQAKRLIFLSGGVFTAETRMRLNELGTLQLEKPIDTKELRSSVMSVATGATSSGTVMAP